MCERTTQIRSRWKNNKGLKVNAVKQPQNDQSYVIAIFVFYAASVI